MALTAYLARLYGPLTALSNINVDITTTLVSFERVFEVLDLKPMVDEKPDAVALPRGPASIEFEHVDFAYPTSEEVSLASLEAVAVTNAAPHKQVSEGCLFTVEPGQLVALVGPSGAGKTTISHLRFVGVSRDNGALDGGWRRRGGIGGVIIRVNAAAATAAGGDSGAGTVSGNGAVLGWSSSRRCSFPSRFRRRCRRWCSRSR